MGQRFEGGEREPDFATLYVANVGSRQSRELAEILLRQAPSLPMPTNDCAQVLQVRHDCQCLRDGTFWSTVHRHHHRLLSEACMPADLLDQLATPHDQIYRSLQGIRETFHREGRISDANAKLDETVKLLAVHFGFLNGLVSPDQYRGLTDRRSFSVAELNRTFAHVASSPMFQRRGMGSIFGETPSTAFKDGDEVAAFELFEAAGHAFAAHTRSEDDLDILGHAFGHHVRDNFRNHIEDAQYMTPPEVVDFMVEWAATLTHSARTERNGDFVVADPSCGVGSFLTRWRSKHGHSSGTCASKCIGQDKVDRMVRLTAINMAFSGFVEDDVFLGSSLEDRSPISSYRGRVDLILTNPPFGARFSIEDLRLQSPSSTPFFAGQFTPEKRVSSEVLFIDLYLSLLKPGGVCLVVLPDSVISAKGMPAVARQHLTRNAEVLGVVDLPSVTFAQAGTRTKTAILAFRKTPAPRTSYAVHFAEISDLGFVVSKRKGVPVKRREGCNQLPLALAHLRGEVPPGHRGSADAPKVAADTVCPSELSAWTPRTLLFDRKRLSDRSSRNLRPLSDFVEDSRRRRPSPYREDCYFISVLHIIGDGLFDIAGIQSYQPVTPGIPVQPGEVLLARINPRIPRVAVVPHLGKELLCSSEFEVLKPAGRLSPFDLAFVLLSPIVQEQIQSLTAGTSASHSRIRSQDIRSLLVPDLRGLRSGPNAITRTLHDYEDSCERITASLMRIAHARQEVRL